MNGAYMLLYEYVSPCVSPAFGLHFRSYNGCETPGRVQTPLKRDALPSSRPGWTGEGRLRKKQEVLERPAYGWRTALLLSGLGDLRITGR